MKIFNWYIAKNLLFTLAMAMGLLAFVMLSAHLFRLFTFLATGSSPMTLCRMLFYLLPDILRYAMPLSMLVATVLVFSRLSADSELVALQASGISIWQAVAPGLLLSIILCALGVWIGLYLSPEMRHRSTRLQWTELSENPLSMLEPGMVVKLSDTTSIRVESIDSNNIFHNVHLYDLDSEGNTLRDLTAATGELRRNPRDGSMELLARKFTIAQHAVTATELEKQRSSETPAFLSADSIVIPISNESNRSRRLTRKSNQMPVGMLLGYISLSEAEGENANKQWLDLQQRLSLAFSPLAFLLLGIPFGIRNRRSDTSSGLIICVILGLVYYAFVLLSDTLLDYPALHPEILIWIPNIAYQALGIYALTRHLR